MNNCNESLGVPGFEEIDLESLFPNNWKEKTKIVDVAKHGTNIEITIKVSATSVEDIKKWLCDYEECTLSKYSVCASRKCSNVYVHFKQILRCQHNTNCLRTYTAGNKCRTKNTNCPAYLNITLRRVAKKYRGKNPNKQPDPLMPCEIVVRPIHNHSVGDADSLRFRKMALETKEELLNLFRNGYSPATALQSLKTDICSNNDNFELILADRKFYPLYKDCYDLYKNEFKKQYGSIEYEDDQDSLKEHNTETNCDSAAIASTSDEYSHLTDTLEMSELLPKEAENNDIYVNEGKILISKIADTLCSFLKQSPLEAKNALEKMENNLLKIKTMAAFSSSCRMFGSGFKKHNRLSKIPIQSSAISRHKLLLKRKSSSAGGRPRKPESSSKKSSHSINAIANVHI